MVASLACLHYVHSAVLHFLDRTAMGLWQSCMDRLTSCSLLSKLYFHHRACCRLRTLKFQGILFAWVASHTQSAHCQTILTSTSVYRYSSHHLDFSAIHLRIVRFKLDQGVVLT